ncbi:putative 3-oxoadipate enol-lactone hydrolase/4-carboxymuconolactone decarboxylase [Actinacidiphila reveromycinica]|uniref:Putative 3-oxoadipate enol-lactone hydrolase/4-carboxymuconolactone decarboxylase n=1 Tax=Actinacidiphila reveromycinica TaxID=659352 RepID=A0A7U3UPK1_9ACTN|nr:3-oxoadipate enol-lactonase [Streptomyces sp. SN-593]BBA96407.1 putative 3-oxoadipate enol-lactone hydrolase/4-carboxymuconolactone decarboxylase [Streptomyces sp. SN-593]
MTSLPHHVTDGRADAPALLLGPSLGTSLHLWDAQVPALARGHRVVRYDLPGHGGSPSALLTGITGPPTVAALAGLVLDLADSLGIGRFAYAGDSLGGAVGTWLALHHPDRLTSLALVCTAARFGDPQGWHDRAAQVRAHGLGALADSAPERWFTPAFRTSGTARALIDDHRHTDPAGYAACCEALAAFDVRDQLHRVTAPVLVIAGRQDRATPPEDARLLADSIAGSTLLELDAAAHLAPAEQPQRVLHALLDHLGAESRPAAGHAATTHAAGAAVRRAVLGDAHVERAGAATTAFTAPFQDLITRYAWGEIWTRPGLDRRTRSCMTLTALVALGHHDELAMHVRAARTNGLTDEEIQEVLLQSAIYCGVPAANTAFAIAARVLADLDA